MKEMNRRAFLKGAALGALSLAATGTVSALAEGGVYTPGTYSATANGIGEVKVEMTFDANSITAVTVDTSNETPSIGKEKGEAIAALILAAQSAEIDAIAGATVTCNAAMKAAAACIAQAKGETVALGGETAGEVVVPEGLTAAEVECSACELGEITPDEEKDYDIVVVGGGAAGVPAACYAAELGAKVALLQKESVCVSQGGSGSAIIKSKSTEAGLEKWIHLTNNLCDWRCDKKLLRAYIEHSEEAVLWCLDRAGLNEANGYTNGEITASVRESDMTGVWQDRYDIFDFGEDVVHILNPNIGPKPKDVGTYVRTILANELAKMPDNLHAYMSTPGIQLVKDGDKVVGVIGKTAEGKYIKFNAKKVILATGDYQNNDAMVDRWCPDVAEFDKKQYHKTGDGHIMAIAAGAKMENIGHTKMMHDFDSGKMFEEPFLYVNMEGKRFTNEDLPFVYMGNLLKYQKPFGGGANINANHPNGSKGWYCEIFDADYPNYANAPASLEALESCIPEGEAPVGVIDYLRDTYRADTIEELAGKLGIDAAELQATIDRYNELCAQGKDTDFGKNPKYMNPIKTAPFWGIRKHIRVSAICGGVNINENGQALNADGEPIDGLYAIGNLGGPFYGGNDYPMHQGGLSLGRCYTFGVIAAKHAFATL